MLGVKNLSTGLHVFSIGYLVFHLKLFRSEIEIEFTHTFDSYVFKLFLNTTLIKIIVQKIEIELLKKISLIFIFFWNFLFNIILLFRNYDIILYYNSHQLIYNEMIEQ